MRVLVVDDEPLIRGFLELALRDEGYEVTTAGDGREALALAAATRPDLVLLDLQMPGMDGWTTHQRLAEWLPEVPVIYMTAGAVAEREAQVHGADGYLAKPFALDELLAAVARFKTSACPRQH